jgi:hypothetical protein
VTARLVGDLPGERVIRVGERVFLEGERTTARRGDCSWRPVEPVWHVFVVLGCKAASSTEGIRLDNLVEVAGFALPRRVSGENPRAPGTSGEAERSSPLAVENLVADERRGDDENFSRCVGILRGERQVFDEMRFSRTCASVESSLSDAKDDTSCAKCLSGTS